MPNSQQPSYAKTSVVLENHPNTALVKWDVVDGTAIHSDRTMSSFNAGTSAKRVASAFAQNRTQLCAVIPLRLIPKTVEIGELSRLNQKESREVNGGESHTKDVLQECAT